MMPHHFTRLLTFILIPALMLGGTAVASATPPTPWINAAGLVRFWEIHDVLVADESPTEQQWSAMFSAPGYAQLDRVERRSAWMKPVYEKAYCPSMAEEVVEWGGLKQYVTTMILPHLEQVAAHRDEIDGFVERISTEETLEEAIRLAQNWLPDDAARRELVPPVQLVIVDGDGKALDGSIVIDVYGLSCYPHPIMFIAHELHHVFRHELDCMRYDDIPPEQEALIIVLKQLEEEGMAEMIDKPALAFGDEQVPDRTMAHPMMSWVWTRYQSVLDEAPEMLSQLNAALATVAQNSVNAGPEGQRIAELMPAFARHTIGMYMAYTIEQRLGKKRLIETVGNPFAFALAYAEATYGPDNDAARTPPFSDHAIDLLVRWENKYIEP